MSMNIHKPLHKATLDSNQDIILQILDYYRCLDTFEIFGDDADADDECEPDTDDDDSGDHENIYTKEKQNEMSHNHPLLIKVYGILESGHSITLNLKGFKPFFYIKIPDHWKSKECSLLVDKLRSSVYYKYKKHLVNPTIVKRKPFKEFTGDDLFLYLKLSFINKESYDAYMWKLSKPFTVPGLNKGIPYKYDLYESNIEPILKLIHLTKINPSGWIRIPAKHYELVTHRTTSTYFEIQSQWNNILPYDKMENAPINIMAFDIEADSSHGDFPIGKKNYQKLAQELITLYNKNGINVPKLHAKMHQLFKKSPKDVIENILHLIFDDNYTIHNNNIHQIRTLENLKPHPDTLVQLSYAIWQLCDSSSSNDDKINQLTDLFEYNLPQTDITLQHNSDYHTLASEVVSQLNLLIAKKNKRFISHPIDIIKMMLNLAFNDFFDAFTVSNIFTKNNIKPNQLVIDAITPSVLEILQNCSQFVAFKKCPEGVLDTEISQDFFIKNLTTLFDQYLPPVEGDTLIQIGSTFQLSTQSDCYLKYIICLDECANINNDEMILFENKDISLPNDVLASDLIHYEEQLGHCDKLTPSEFDKLFKLKLEEIKTWDSEYKRSQCGKAIEYHRIKQSLTDHATVIVDYCHDERDILLKWRNLIKQNDPDIVVGYNIFGFDCQFLYDRATELDCVNEFSQLGRLNNCTELFYEQKLSSAGLGDNTLKYIPMSGRVLIDLYKVIQNMYKLDSYKLNYVSHKFLNREKADMKPQEIFILQKGTPEDRKKIAIYCLIDCILCNRILLMLEIISNNIAQANVCKVPFTYLFVRGQGVKILSLIAEYCSKPEQGYLLPVLPKADMDNTDSYEGAIVLTPDVGIHLDPVAVGDFNSLYPSSMISENISHDSYVTDIGGKYDNLPGYTYTNISYDIYKTTTKPGSKKKIKQKVGVKVCRYAQLPDGKKSILPSILSALLAARKATNNKIKTEKDPFKAKLLNGLQLAYKITANSLYGQCGAKTSPIYKVEIAASTTAVGRSMILFSKKFIETNYKDVIVTHDIKHSGVENPETKEWLPTKYTGQTVHVKNSFCVYGDTDSVFIKFGLFNPDGTKIQGPDAINHSIALCKKACNEISLQLKKPQNIEFEKSIDPLILFSRKRYHGRYFTKMDCPKYYDNSMGIVTKRRDNAPIVKHVFTGSIDIIMNEHDINKAYNFAINECQKILRGEFPIDKFIISKTLRSFYKKPLQIAHNVLALRQAQRDPGNRFAPNDRVPYVFIINETSKDLLQGDKIETPEFTQQNNLQLDYKMYITHQIMVPVSQIFGLVKGFEKTEQNLMQMIDKYEAERTGNISLDIFFKKTEGKFMGTFDNKKKIEETAENDEDEEEEEEEEDDEEDEEFE